MLIKTNSKLLKCVFLFISLFFYSYFSYLNAQEDVPKSSSYRDSLYLRSLLDMSNKYINEYFDSSYHYANLLNTEAINRNNTYFQISSQVQLSWLSRLNGDYSKAQYYLYNALNIIYKTKKYNYLANVYANLSDLFHFYDDNLKALEYAKLSIKYDYYNKDYKQIYISYTNLGNAYRGMGDFPNALNAFKASLFYAFKDNNFVGMGGTYYNISIIFSSLNQDESAQEYNHRAKYYFEKADNQRGIGFCLIKEGIFKRKEGLKQQALDCYQKALSIFNVIKDFDLISNCYEGIAEIHNADKSFENAVFYNLKALELREKIENMSSVATSYINLGEIYLAWNKPQKALEYLKKAIPIISELNLTDDLRLYHKQMALIDSSQGNFKSAYTHLRRYHALNDSLNSTENQNLAANFKANHEFEKKEYQLSLKQKQKELEALTLIQNKQNERNIAITSSFAILLIGSAYFVHRNKIRKEKDRLMQFQLSEYEMKALRSQINAHFIFNALNGINHLIFNKAPEKASSYLHKFANLLRITVENTRSSWVSLRSELEAIQYYIDLESIDLGSLIELVIQIDENIATKNILIPPMLMQPLIENSFKHGLQHNSAQFKLGVLISELNNELIIQIVDNGPEINAPTSNNSAEGLSLATKIIEERLHILNHQTKSQAKISREVKESVFGKCTVAELRLPVVLDE